MLKKEEELYTVGKVHVEKALDVFGGIDAIPSTDKEIQVRASKERERERRSRSPTVQRSSSRSPSSLPPAAHLR